MTTLVRSHAHVPELAPDPLNKKLCSRRLVTQLEAKNKSTYERIVQDQVVADRTEKQIKEIVEDFRKVRKSPITENLGNCALMNLVRTHAVCSFPPGGEDVVDGRYERVDRAAEPDRPSSACRCDRNMISDRQGQAFPSHIEVFFALHSPLVVSSSVKPFMHLVIQSV